MKEPLRIGIVGAGSRGFVFGRLLKEMPGRARVVAVAEPREFYRRLMADEQGVPPELVFKDWREMASRPKFVDAVVVATLDTLHTEPTIAFAAQGCHILLEKPMAPTEAECRRIAAAVRRNKVILAVGHVLRYTPFTATLKKHIGAGLIGDVAAVQHIEAVAPWHFAHAYVRGKWAVEKESSPVLLAKCCHDLDWIRYIMGTSCKKVSSFGHLRHFRRSNMPAGAAERCVDCKVESACPYSAKRIYLGFFEKGSRGWPLDVITNEVTKEGVMEAVSKGRYGRCVYACDNDVPDTQIVNMLFEGGRMATHIMTAFANDGRRTRVFGTRGELEGNSSAGAITHRDWLTGETKSLAVESPDNDMLTGHGGGDGGLLNAFISAVEANDQGLLLSGPMETLESHLMVFAAEQSRREGGSAVEVRV